MACVVDGSGYSWVFCWVTVVGWVSGCSKGDSKLAYLRVGGKIGNVSSQRWGTASYVILARLHALRRNGQARL